MTPASGFWISYVAVVKAALARSGDRDPARADGSQRHQGGAEEVQAAKRALGPASSTGSLKPLTRKPERVKEQASDTPRRIELNVSLKVLPAGLGGAKRLEKAISDGDFMAFVLAPRAVASPPRCGWRPG